MNLCVHCHHPESLHAHNALDDFYITDLPVTLTCLAYDLGVDGLLFMHCECPGLVVERVEVAA